MREFQELGKMAIREEAVLEKFNEPEHVLAERITLVDGVVVKHEHFENGELVSSTEPGGEIDGTN